jgi:hypothetical protein
MLMKTKLLFCCISIFLSFSAASQTLPISGSTWYFKAGFSPWFNEYLEKWEYTGDSVAADGVYKKLFVTTKTSWPSPENVVTNIYNKLFRYSNDSVWTIESGEQYLLADFGATVGDSLLTPYYNSYNLGLMSSGNCTEVDSNVILQKGVVTEMGVIITDGISSNYYKLRYLSDTGDSVTKIFSERSIITDGYWYDISSYLCMVITESSGMNLICHYDDSSDIVCVDTEYWFDHLGLPENDALQGLKLYPNPAEDKLQLFNPSEENLNVVLTDINGRKLKKVTLGAAVITSVEISELAAGSYMLYFESADGGLACRQFVKR